jgi:hypothetical protein
VIDGKKTGCSTPLSFCRQRIYQIVDGYEDANETSIDYAMIPGAALSTILTLHPVIF